MTKPQKSSPCRTVGNGFTLIELMIVLVVIGILAAIAYPSFVSVLARSDRSDARGALMNVQLAQERFRATNGAYTQSFNDLPGLDGSSENQWYNLTISNVDRSGYTVTATAVAGGRQATRDSATCQSIVLRVTQGGETRTPAECW